MKRKYVSRNYVQSTTHFVAAPVDALIKNLSVTTSTTALTVTMNRTCYVRLEHVSAPTVAYPIARQ